MREIAFQNFRALSKMHSELADAFEYFENTGNDEKYRALLEFWQNYLRDEPKCTKKPVEFETLEKFERQLYQSYSPIEFQRERIESIREDVVNYLQCYSVDALIQQNATFLLSRLLYNCLLVERCFFPLFDKAYQNHISNIENQLNICIIIGQSDYFSEYFRYILHQFNEEFISLREVSAHILHIVGVLNFKCHNYKKAIEIFLRAISQFEDEDKSDAYKNDEYFQTKLLLAYCYEYDHQFENAIEELVGVPVEELLRGFNNFDMFSLFDIGDINRAKRWSSRFISIDIPRIVEKYGSTKKINNLLGIASLRDTVSNEVIGDKHEVLHNLAHCLNELGIKKKLGSDGTNGKDNVVSLLYLSRAIMLYVAEFNEECRDFQTCLYMLFGEAKDYDICLKRINQMIEEYSKSGLRNINYKMENMFYLFLVANQSGRIVDDEQLAKKAEDAYQCFTQLANRRYDYDALTHIEIFKFRFEIINILRFSIDNAEIEKSLIELRDKPFGKYVLSIRPSARANRWIIQEYRKTIALYEFLVKYFEDQDEIDINELYNFAYRFHFYRNLFEKGEDKTAEEDMKTAISRIIRSIVDDFISPQSIFLLAPLTSAIPYQNQTKTFQHLEESLFPSKMEKFDLYSKMERFADLVSTKHPNQNHIDWLLAHKEYGFSFSAFRMDPGREDDRYYYCDNGDIFERPIHNVMAVNRLVQKIKLHKKRHNNCQNGQTRCCISIFNDSDSKKHIRDICKELMIPAEKYQNKTFVFYCRKDNPTRNQDTYWHIIGINHKLCSVQEQELIALLCGHDLNREYKLAVSRENYCYICYDVMNSMVAKSDMYWLQEHGVRFWYDQEMKESYEKFVHQEYMDQAKALIFFISNQNFEAGLVQSRLYKEILYASQQNIENRIVIAVNFKAMTDLTKYLHHELSEEGDDKIFRYLMGSPIIYGVEGNENNVTFHLESSNILSHLKEYGVECDEL